MEDGNETLSFTYLAQYHSLDTEYYVETADGEYVIKRAVGVIRWFPGICSGTKSGGIMGERLQIIFCKKTARFTMLQDWPVLVPDGQFTSRKQMILIISEKIRNAGMLDVQKRRRCSAETHARRFYVGKSNMIPKIKKVYFYEKRGADRGVYFKDGLNLKKIDP